jgi:hypothetical protein
MRVAVGATVFWPRAKNPAVGGSCTLGDLQGCFSLLADRGPALTQAAARVRRNLPDGRAPLSEPEQRIARVRATTVDHDNSVLTLQGEYRPAEGYGSRFAAVGGEPRLHPCAAPPCIAGTCFAVEIPSTQPG